jgi:hypothetical protein
MKRGTAYHKKTIRLAEELKIPLPYAVGLLSMLWEFTADRRPEGDIGSIPDLKISEAVYWPKKASVLINALCNTGWLDRHPEHRMIVHDWPDHAEHFVCRKLIRSGKDFLSCYGKSVRDRAKALGCGPVDSKGCEENGAPSHGALAMVKVPPVLETCSEEKTSTRAREENPASDSPEDLDLDDPIEEFVPHAASRAGKRRECKAAPREQERLDERWKQAQRDFGRAGPRAAWLRFLREADLGGMQSPQAVFLAQIGRWLPPDDTPPVSVAGSPTVGTSVAAVVPAVDYPAIWNRLVPAMRYEWHEAHGPRKLLDKCAADPMFQARFEELCELAQAIHVARRADASWLNFAWILRQKEGDPPNWYKALTEMRGMAYPPEEQTSKAERRLRVVVQGVQAGLRKRPVREGVA